MEMHQLRYFVAIAETGSFTRAAERCYVAQPSLSQQIQKLERYLKKPLFDRLGKRVRLTEAGEALLARAQRILAEVDDTARELSEEAGPGEGRLSLGAIPTIGPYWLPPVLTRFLRRYPRIETHLREDVTANLLGALHEGEIDLAFIALPIVDSHLETKILRRERLLAALPSRHRLSRHKAITLGDLEEEPFILLGDMHCLTGQVTAYCQSKFMPRIACRCVQLPTIQKLVGLGIGVSLLPAMACKPETGIAYKSMHTPEPTRTLGVVWHKQKYLSPNVKALLEMLAH
jgi:LysR family hydrogen peroxide-inducible transcriptional activator